MASGVVFGKIVVVKGKSVLLDDGVWYGHPDMEQLIIDHKLAAKTLVMLAFYTKSVKNDDTGKWTNYHNILRLRVVLAEGLSWSKIGTHFMELADQDLPTEVPF